MPEYGQQYWVILAEVFEALKESYFDDFPEIFSAFSTAPVDGYYYAPDDIDLPMEWYDDFEYGIDQMSYLFSTKWTHNV